MDFLASPDSHERSWRFAVLVGFVSFFVVSFVVVQIAFVFISRQLVCGLDVRSPPGEVLILLQVVLDMIWIGFIFFLIKVVHHRPIWESLHWLRSPRYKTSSLILL